MRILPRSLPRSLQGRMLALSAIATLVSLVVAGTLIAGVLARVVTGGIDQRLDAELALMASVVTDDGVDRARLARLDGPLDAGAGWHWRIDGLGGGIGSADMPLTGPPPPDARGHGGPGRHPGDDRTGRPRPLDGASRSGVPTHARQLTIKTRRGPVVLTATAPRDVIARPLLGALAPMLVTLALLGALLAAAAVLQIRLGLRPVRRLRDGIGQVRAGAAPGVAEDQPDELRPLAAELNALIRDNDAALAAARASAANLAHALKTPVATLALDLRGDPRLRQVERIDATIRHHLARARVGLGSRRPATALAPAIDGLIAAVMRLAPDRAVTMRTAVPVDTVVAVDAADLDELVGNLIDNAVRHAASLVAVDAAVDGRRVMLTVADNGPGIPAAERARATQAGVRLDERGDGHGFGLAIARELAAVYGGLLSLSDRAGGGLIASVSLPLAHAGGAGAA